jgi:hypothetical protein
MFKKILTNLIIFMLTVLPVQVIAASIENDLVKLSDKQAVQENIIQVKHECMHGNADKVNKSSDMPCCEDSFAFHQCNGCDNCGECIQGTTVMTEPAIKFSIPSNFKNQKIVSNHLFLNGISSKSPIRPPRTLI